MEIKYLDTKVQTVLLCDTDTCTKCMTTFLHKSTPFEHKWKNVRIVKLGMYKPLTTVLSKSQYKQYLFKNTAEC